MAIEKSYYMPTGSYYWHLSTKYIYKHVYTYFVQNDTFDLGTSVMKLSILSQDYLNKLNLVSRTEMTERIPENDEAGTRHGEQLQEAQP